MTIEVECGIQYVLSPVFCKMREKKEVGGWTSEKY